MSRRVVAVVAAIAVAFGAFATLAASPASADSLPQCEPGMAVQKDGTCAYPEYSEETMRLAEEIWADLEATYTEAEISETDEVTTISFADRATGEEFTYELTKSYAEPQPGEFGPLYRVTWNGWELTRAETRELASEGQQAAIIYAIAAYLGCRPCAIGALIEGAWASYAARYYNRGNCIKIYYWLTVGELNC
ncbi:hypothetical protein [Glycomyces harbinensis]|nr:hypothetical protein [Glycomyces harbinensis]